MKAISAITATLSILSIGILLSAQAAQAAQSTEPKFISGSVKQTTTMDALTSKVQWKQAAQGVWLTEIGDMSKELRYTDLAAEAPRLERINKLSKQDFPFKEGDIKTTINPDGRIMIRIPCGPDEKLYGYGLQLDKLNQTSRVLTLNVDHWGKGGGRTHAPAPFYISSKGYGVFLTPHDTSKFITRSATARTPPNVRQKSTAIRPRMKRPPSPDHGRHSPKVIP
jgi:hypothetical protein